MLQLWLVCRVTGLASVTVSVVTWPGQAGEQDHHYCRHPHHQAHNPDINITIFILNYNQINWYLT